VLPNKNPLPRTHVNTSQLAASTEKLFEQSESMEKRMDSFQDEMRAEMAEMRAFMKLQQEKIEALEFKLAASEAELSYQQAYKNEATKEDKKVKTEDDLKPPRLINSYLLLPTVQDKDPKTVQIQYHESTIKISDEDACIFSLNTIPRSLSPIQIITPSKPEPPQSMADIVLKNPEKAIASRDFCGNC
jgi:hypothetical protein